MPMHIPKPRVLWDTDLHNMTFAEAQLFPFTGEHQPSLAKFALRKAVIDNKKKAIPGARLALSRV